MFCYGFRSFVPVVSKLGKSFFLPEKLRLSLFWLETFVLGLETNGTKLNMNVLIFYLKHVKINMFMLIFCL